MTAVDYNCPAWCERTDHDADVVDEQHPPLHYGPEFASADHYVVVDGRDDAMGVCINAENDGMLIGGDNLPARLRELAANLTRAAEWLEANR